MSLMIILKVLEDAISLDSSVNSIADTSFNYFVL